MRRSLLVTLLSAVAVLAHARAAQALPHFLDPAALDALAVPPLSPSSDAAKERGYFGINIEAKKDTGEAWGGDEGETGIALTLVTSGGAASKAGLVEGDILVRVDETGFGADPAHAVDTFLKLAVTCVADQVVSVTYIRDGKRATAAVTLIGPVRIDAPVPFYMDYDWSEVKSPLEAELRALGAWEGLDGVRAQMQRAARSTYNPRQLLPDNPAPFRLTSINRALMHPMQLGRQAVEIADAMATMQSPAMLAMHGLSTHRPVRPL
jgi:hypothetical protein